MRFREQIREAASPHYDILENRVLTGFLGFFTHCDSIEAGIAQLAS